MKENELKNKGFLFRDREQVKPFEKRLPLLEYPRPQLRRDSYFSLNGEWELAISKKEEIPSEFPLKVNVPYAVESALSGVNHLLEPDEYLFYRKKVTLPEGFRKEKILLHFDGVDQECEVYINGLLVKKHVSGYTPFEIELPFGVSDKFELIVKVKDESDASYHSRGKQVLKPFWYNYTSSSGIYKPVWVESVYRNYIQSVRFTPLFDKQMVAVKIMTKNKTYAKIKIGKVIYRIDTNAENYLPVVDFHPWSVEDPYLYPVSIETECDAVTSYFGMRVVEIKEENGFKHIYLNHKPVFMSGLLDQGYYFISNLTPRSYKDYEDDIKATKLMGFNTLRVHIKTECEYFYYLADKLGMLLIQDFPCGGEHYSFYRIGIPRVLNFMNQEKHINYKNMGRLNETGRAEFEEEAKEYLSLYYNHPSVVIYTIFNEGWGEFDPSRIYHELKELDPTRLYDTASGWYDADSDFFSIHTYSFPKMKRKNKKKRVFVISEMGGCSLKDHDHSYFEGFFGHGKCKTKKELEEKISKLYLKDILPQIERDGLNMAIYTELADCETEYNGLLTYDRKVTKIDPTLMKKLNSDLYLAFDKQFKKSKKELK
jgi:beta-galactosidase/beta-glucuronidase